MFNQFPGSEQSDVAAAPTIDSFLDHILGRLLSDNDADRQETVRLLRAKETLQVPELIAMTTQRLVALLTSQSEQKLHRATESLVDLGEAALPVLFGMFSSSTGTLKARLAEVLGRIGADSPPAQQVQIQTHLSIGLATEDAAVMASIIVALDRIRPGSAAAELAFLAARVQPEP